MTTDPRKLAQELREYKALVPGPFLTFLHKCADALDAALDERDHFKRAAHETTLRRQVFARLQAENEAYRELLMKIRRRLQTEDIELQELADLFEENHGKQ